MKKTLLSMLLLLLFVAGAKAQDDIPLTFEAIDAGTVALEKVGNFTPNNGVQYRIGETGDWSSYSYGTGISLQAGEKLQFRSTSSVSYSTSRDKYSHFTCTADCYLYGNLGSLFNYWNSLPSYACTKMFYGNTHIKNSTDKSLVLPATSLGNYCYQQMFYGCTALTTAPALPATSLNYYCYQEMFSHCTALTTAPALPATSLAEGCYQEMFDHCSALTEAPALPATTLVHDCYRYMFEYCSHLNYVRCLAMDISAGSCIEGWLYGVAYRGTFVKASGMENWTTSPSFPGSGIPDHWTIEDFDPTLYPLTFEAIEAGTIALEKVGDFTPNSEVQYRIGETGDWSSYSYGTGISLQAGQMLQFSSTSSTAYAQGDNQYSHFTCTADCYLYGNLGSLFNNSNSLPSHACTKMFYGNTHIKNYTDNSLVLPATSLADSCYERMFSGCTALTTAPALPATSLANGCYTSMFSGCTALTSAPTLPASSLAISCYREMFSGCTALATAPALPASSLVEHCYYGMFSGCTALTSAPALLASTLVDGCYYGMFEGCTNLNYVRCLATDISASSCTLGWLSEVAATGTFDKAPGMENWTTGDSGIPAGWSVEDFVQPMYPLTFEAIEAGTVTLEKVWGGTPNNGIQYRIGETGDWSSYSYGTGISLQAGEKLQFSSIISTAYALGDNQYSHFTCTADCYLYGNLGSLFNYWNSLPSYACTKMFYGNTHIKNHTDKSLVLPAASLAESCCEEMFSGCTGLTTAPALPATTLAYACYSHMFSGCTALTSAPELPATTLVNRCYYCMFYGCSALTSAPELPATTLVNRCYSFMFAGCTHLNYVRCLATDISATECTYSWFRSVAATGVFFKASGMENWTTGDNGIPSGWIVEDHDIDPITVPLTFQAGEAGTITVKKDEGSTLNPIQYSLNGSEWAYVSWNTPISLAATDVICFRGNNGTCCVYVDVEGLWQPLGFHFECSNPCYVYGNVMSLIDQNGFDTNTTLTETFAFYRLFRRDDVDPHTILNHPLFNIVLPATTLTADCYNSMFMNCQGITRAPALPATTLAEECYSSMFSSCTNLATAPILPATTLASKCYSNMFSECESLTVAPELPATELYNSCYDGMFNNCLYLTTAPSLPATTLANDCYNSMFNGCRRLATAPALPATTLAESCYFGMFQGCRALTTAPALPATTLANNCYRDMFKGCIHLTTAPWLPATTLVNNCYYQMFSGCSKLDYVVCLATNISASNCVKNWLSNVAGTGTFVKASNMTSWPSGNSGIPSGWSVININQFTTDGNWNVPGNWSNNAVPEAGNSVVISANATIPNGYTANVDYIIVDEGKTLTIADGGQLIHNNAGVVATVQKNITGRNNGGGWNFIASPVATVAPSAANGLLSGDYDLYYYHEGTHIWRNYKGSTDDNHADPGFNLINGKGYLYANTGATTLSFTGALGTQGMIALDFNTDEGAVLPGWNLVGNPFPCNVTSDLPYYLIDGSTNQLNGTPYQAGTTIPSCTGIMVKADESGQSVTFTKVAAQQSNIPSGLQIALSQVVEAPESNSRFASLRGTKQSSTLDNAIVSFSEGNQLEKFIFDADLSKLYIPQDGKDYAIVTAEAQGEIPVNFRAAENGPYTITVNPENVEMGYLHLIDNMTGADVDLLTTPNYTFNAKTTDYASRFRLVFSASGDADGDDAPFAFVSNGNIVFTGMGGDAFNASLQIVDVQGRIIVCRDAVPASLSIAGMASGVYVLRLITGNDVKTQKIVIR